MAGQRVHLVAGVNVPHNQIAVLGAGYHLRFVVHRHGHTGDGIRMADEHLGEFAAGRLPDLQRHVTRAGDHVQRIDGDDEAGDFVRMRHGVLFVLARQRPDLQAGVAVRAALRTSLVERNIGLVGDRSGFVEDVRGTVIHLLI